MSKKSFYQNYSDPNLKELAMDISLDYVAGIVDGEGSIYFGLTHGKGHLQAILTVKMCDFIVPLSLYGKFGGTFKRVKRSGFRKDIWEWKVGSRREVVKILKLLAPKLLVKRKQAELVISYFDDINFRKNNRLEFSTKMKELNARGKKAEA